MPRRLIPGVYRLPSGRWSVRIRRPDGRRPNATFATRGDAEAAATALRRHLALARLGLAEPETERSGPRTLAELWGAMERHQRAAGRAPLTIAQTAQAASLWIRALGASHPVPLRRDDVTRFLAWLRDHSASRGRLIQACLVAVRTAHRLSEMEPPPVPRLSVPSGSRRTLEPAAFEAWAAALPLGSAACTAAALVYLLAARESEVMRLRVEDVDPAPAIGHDRVNPAPATAGAGIVRLWQAKGAVRGQVALPVLPDLARVLKSYAAPSEGLYLGTDDPHRLRPALARASEEAGVQTVRGLGWLRNQAATTLGQAGVAPEVLSRVLRHASSSRGLLGRYDQSRREAEVREALGLLRWPTSARLTPRASSRRASPAR